MFKLNNPTPTLKNVKKAFDVLNKNEDNMGSEEILMYLKENITADRSDGWEIVDYKCDGFMYRNKKKGLLVIVSISKENDGLYWVHVSFSRKSRMPSYFDITLVKKLFIGEDKKAIMVFPSKKEHVNFHEYCLHLFHCIEKDVLPDFTKGTESL